MALALGTNCGFVASAPSADPSGLDFGIDTRGVVIRDTAPATSTKITEVGWYCDNATEEANFEVGLYAPDGATVPGEAGTRLYVAATNAKGTGNGWLKVTVDWNITAGNVYWIGLQCDDTATTTNTNYASSGASGYDWKAATSLPDPFAGGALSDADGVMAIYALWSAGAAPTTMPSMMMTGMGY